MKIPLSFVDAICSKVSVYLVNTYLQFSIHFQCMTNQINNSSSLTIYHYCHSNNNAILSKKMIIYYPIFKKMTS